MTLYQAMVNRLVTPVIQAHEARGREEGKVEGWAEGLVEGRVEGLEKGRVEGLEKGRVEGLVEGRVEGLAEGRAEGQAAERARWVDWNRRRMEAAAKGQPFDEPPPGAE